MDHVRDAGHGALHDVVVGDRSLNDVDPVGRFDQPVVAERADAYAATASADSVLRNPKGPDEPYDPMEPSEKKRVHRGGSFLCTDQYCTRYMVGTRGKGDASTGSNHLGFRLVR